MGNTDGWHVMHIISGSLSYNTQFYLDTVAGRGVTHTDRKVAGSNPGLPAKHGVAVLRCAMIRFFKRRFREFSTRFGE